MSRRLNALSSRTILRASISVEVQNVIKDFQQRLPACFFHGTETPLFGIQIRHKEQLEHAKDPVHGSMNLMAHVGEKATLGVIGGVCAFTGLNQFFFVEFALGNLFRYFYCLTISTGLVVDGKGDVEFISTFPSGEVLRHRIDLFLLQLAREGAMGLLPVVRVNRIGP